MGFGRDSAAAGDAHKTGAEGVERGGEERGSDKMKWPEYPLASISERFLSGGTPSTKVAEYWTGEIPWITGADIVDGEVILGRRYINEAAVKNSATNVVPKGSLLMVTRTGVGKIALAPIDVAISQDFTGLVFKESVHPKYALAAIRFRMPILSAVPRKATIQGVTRADVENLKIPIPPPSEQRPRVEILDQAEMLRKKRPEADVQAAHILPALFYKMFGDPTTNPRKWPTANLEVVAEIGTQLVDPNQSQFVNLPHIGGEQIEKETGRILSPKLVRESDLRSAKFHFTSDHILYSKIRPYLNKVAFPRFEGVCSADIYPIRPRKGRLSHWYLVALLRSPAFLAYAKVHSERLRMAKLNREQLGAFPAPLPDFALLEIFERQASQVQSLEKT